MKQRASAMERANKTALVSYGVMNVILIACYLIEVVKKSRTPGYFAVFCALKLRFSSKRHFIMSFRPRCLHRVEKTRRKPHSFNYN